MNIYLHKYPWLLFYLFATFFSKIGNKMFLVLLPILVYDYTGSATLMGGAFFAQTLPVLLFSPFVGMMIDTLNRKKIMIIAILCRSVLMAIFAFIVYTSLISPILIFSITFLIATTGIVFSLSNETIVTDVSDREDWITVNSHFQLVDTLSMMIGPALAGGLISLFSHETALIINFITFIPILIVLLFLKYSVPANESLNYFAPKNYLKVQKDVIRDLFSNKILLPILLISTIANFSNGIIESMFIFFARDEIGLTSMEIGVIFSIVSFFSLIIGIYAKKITKRFSYSNVLLNTKLISALGVLIMVIAPNWLILAFGKLVSDAPTILSNIVNRTSRQLLVPNKDLGKVNALYRTFVLSSFSIAGLIAGVLSSILGLKITFMLAGLGYCLAFLLFIKSSIRDIDKVYKDDENSA